MFHSIWSKTLRDYRVAILGWGIGLGLLMIAGFATATPAVLAAFISLAPLLRFLGDPYALQTPEGIYELSIHGSRCTTHAQLLAYSSRSPLVRGEEERGTMDVLLATPQPRVRLLLEKIGALLIALILIAVLFALGAVAGKASLGGHVDFVRALLGLKLERVCFFLWHAGAAALPIHHQP